MLASDQKSTYRFNADTYLLLLFHRQMIHGCSAQSWGHSCSVGQTMLFGASMITSITSSSAFAGIKRLLLDLGCVASLDLLNIL